MKGSIGTALICMAIVVGPGPAWANDDPSGVPCNSLCKRWMSWGAPEPEPAPSTVPVQSAAVPTAAPSPVSPPSSLHPLIPVPRVMPPSAHAVVAAVPPRRPRDMAMQVPLPRPAPRAVPKVAALAPGAVVAPPVAPILSDTRPVPAIYGSLAIPIPDVPAVPDIPAVPTTGPADAEPAGTTMSHTAASAPVPETGTSVALAGPAPDASPAAQTPVIASAVITTAIPQADESIAARPARTAAANLLGMDTVFPPFDVIGALLLSTPPRSTLAGAKTSASPQL